MNVLLTGGTGYIGSHIAVVLTKAGHQVILYDNLSNSCTSVIDNLEQITGKKLSFVKGDVRDTELLIQKLQVYKIDVVVHCAGFKAVVESVERPIDYYENNVVGTISLLKAIMLSNIRALIFSSSASVYGEPQYLPIDEEHPTNATHPYGRSKLYIEQMLADLAKSDDTWRIISLRYFNPVGAHDSGLIGEAPNGKPSNLIPYIALVAAQKLPFLSVFGDDYKTKDGTGVRDYIHVMDLAEAHLAALNALVSQSKPMKTFNLGTGQGYSVFEMIRAFESVSKQSVPYQIMPRRTGDTIACFAQADKAANELRWRACRTLEDMCRSTWHFQTKKTQESVEEVNL